MRKKLIVLGMLIFVLIAAKTTSKAAEMLQTTNFKSGVSLPWQVYESAEWNSYSMCKNGALMIHIDNPGTNKWDVQLRHREISLVAGHTYKIHFKLYSQKAQKIYVRIGDKGEPYWEAWNNNWQPYNVGPSGLDVTETFISEKNSEFAEVNFYIGGELAVTLPNEIYFEEMSLQDDEFSPTPVPTATPPRDIRVNQLGYYPDASKKATMVCNSYSALDVELRDSTGKVVWTGKSKPKEGIDKASRENVHIIDFSDFKTEGKDYQLTCGIATSFPFDIGMSLYSQMKWDSLRYFYHARSGIDIKTPYCIESRWARPAGHKKDIATLYPGKNYSDGEYTGGPSTIDGTGGWYDAADFGKYVVNGGLATWTLQNEYEHALKNAKADTFKDGSMNIPESTNGYPDLLDEARYNVEYFLKVQIPAGYNKAGMVIHKLADEFLKEPATRPDQDSQKRYFYPPSTAATLNFAAVVAQAGRLWKNYDSTFSDRCIKAAEIAWEAAKKYPEVYAPLGQEMASGAYGDNNNSDEFYWAACELYITTGKSEYMDYIKSSKYAFKCPITLTGELNNAYGSMDWSNTAACGTIDLVLCAPTGLYAADLAYARDSIAAAADNYTAIQAKEGYGVPLEVCTYVTEYGGQREIITDGYPWASNSYIINQSMIMAYAYDFTGNIKYINGVTEAMDYIMGRNPLFKCYVSGYGENPLKYPHHYFFCPQIDPLSFPSVPPGFLAGGPNSGGQDPWASAPGPKMNAAQKCYVDNVESWQTNEVANEWNAMLAWLTEYLDSNGPKVHTSSNTPTATPDIRPPYYSCDLNEDGAINMGDVMLIAGAFNTKSGDDRFVARYDLNYDSAINIAEVMIIAKYFNTRSGF